MKTVYFFSLNQTRSILASKIPIHTSQGTLEGILDSGSTTTLMKKVVHEDNPSLGLQCPIPGTRVLQSSEGITQKISMALELHLTSDQGYETLISTFFYVTTAPFDMLQGTVFLQEAQAVMPWTTMGLQTFLIPGLADELSRIYDHDPAAEDYSTKMLPHLPDICFSALRLTPLEFS
jgi:hypothetical protein